METWKPIPTFPEYDASNLGRIRSRKWRNERILQLNTHRDKPYAYVVLRRDNRSYHRQVHRLVLWAFTGQEGVGLQCRHKNGNPSDNRIDNLCWGTNTDNFEDAVRHGTNGRGSSSPVAKYTEAQIRLLWKLHKEGATRKQISERTGIVRGTVKNILEGRSWRHMNPNL